jgi:hypothetical protein
MRDLTPIEFRRLESSADITGNPVEEITYQHTVFVRHACLIKVFIQEYGKGNKVQYSSDSKQEQSGNRTIQNILTWVYHMALDHALSWLILIASQYYLDRQELRPSHLLPPSLDEYQIAIPMRGISPAR